MITIMFLPLCKWEWMWCNHPLIYCTQYRLKKMNCSSTYVALITQYYNCCRIKLMWCVEYIYYNNDAYIYTYRQTSNISGTLVGNKIQACGSHMYHISVKFQLEWMHTIQMSLSFRRYVYNKAYFNSLADERMHDIHWMNLAQTKVTVLSVAMAYIDTKDIGETHFSWRE